MVMAKSFKEIGKKTESLIEQGKEADQKVQRCQARVDKSYSRVVAARRRLAVVSETDREGNPVGNVEHARAQLSMAENQLAASQRALSSARGDAEKVRQQKNSHVHEIERHNEVERSNLEKLRRLRFCAFGEDSVALTEGIAQRLNEAEDARVALLRSMGIDATPDHVAVEAENGVDPGWRGGGFSVLDITGKVQSYQGGGSEGLSLGDKIEKSASVGFRTIGSLKIDRQSGRKEYFDDNGNKYREGDCLLPNAKFEVNGYKYKTDDKGRIVCAEGQLRMKESDYDRKMENVRKIEGQDYQDGDDRGHLIAHQFGGSDRLENLELAVDKIIFNPDHKDCMSTSKERKEMANRSKGEWVGTPGDSIFIPKKGEAQEALKKFKQDGIVYKDGEPDFRKVSEATVKIKDMTSDRPYNFRQADEACAKQWNDNKRDNRTDWIPRDVNKWRKENRYSWHERLDMKTMDLVQRDVHEECKHYGGVSECKKRERLSGGGFDE